MGLDSVDLLTKIEKRFKIQIPNHVAEKIVTVKDYHDIVWEFLFTDEKEIKPYTREEMEIIINEIILDISGADKQIIVPSARLCDDLGID